MLGLYAFFYATLHFTTYLWFDKWFDVAAILKDIGKRPFIMVGFAAFVLLIVLAVTSPRAMVRKLGRRWQTLHRAIYVIGVLAILHFWWMKSGKHDLLLPKIYGAIMVALLGWRLLVWLRERRSCRPGRGEGYPAPLAAGAVTKRRCRGGIAFFCALKFASSRQDRFPGEQLLHLFARADHVPLVIDHDFGRTWTGVVVRAHHETVCAGRTKAIRSPGSIASEPLAAEPVAAFAHGATTS